MFIGQACEYECTENYIFERKCHSFELCLSLLLIFNFSLFNLANLRIFTVLVKSDNYIQIANLPSFKMVSLLTSLPLLCLVAALSSTEALKCLQCTSIGGSDKECENGL